MSVKGANCRHLLHLFDQLVGTGNERSEQLQAKDSRRMMSDRNSFAPETLPVVVSCSRYELYAVRASVSLSSLIICFRIMNFCGLPVAVIGNSATNLM